MTSIMEAPAMLENENAPQRRRSTCLRVAFYVLIVVMVIVSALVPIVFCLLYHQQALGSCWAHGHFKSEPPTKNSKNMSWDWNLEHCDGIVQGQGQYLNIQQSGRYFIYGQLYRKKEVKETLTLMLYRYPNIILHNTVGFKNSTINFARPFHLQEGDKLYCRKNYGSDNILLENQTYWGLFKM